MTGARNRRHFYAAIGEFAARQKPAGGPWLMLVDIDHFKQINDRHGHAVGDDVLIEIARRLGLAIGPDGMVVRWGGEEFLLACNGDAQAAGLCRDVMAAVSNQPIATEGPSLPVTCSIGITRARTTGEDMAVHIDTIVARADAAMYRAKNEGRNRAVLAAWSGNELGFETVA